MKTQKNKALYFQILFPIVLIAGNVYTLVKSPPGTSIVVLGVTVGLVLVAFAIWYAITKETRTKRRLAPTLGTSRASGNTAYIFMMNNQYGVVEVTPGRTLNIYELKKKHVQPGLSLSADTYTLSPGRLIVGAMTVDGLNIHANDGSFDLTMMICSDTGIKDDKAYTAESIANLTQIDSDKVS